MKLKKYLLSMTAASLLLTTLAQATVKAETASWKPRTAEQIKADLEVKENEKVYTIQYGDTLGMIAEALDIDVKVLGSINQIADLDLIYPETILTTTYNQANQAQSLTIETPQANDQEEALVAEVDLANNQVVVEEEVYNLEETTQVPSVDQVAEWVSTPVINPEAQVTNEAPVVEETSEITTQAVPETTSLPVEDQVSEWVAPQTTLVEDRGALEEITVPETTEAPAVEETQASTLIEEPVEEVTTLAEVVEETQAPASSVDYSHLNEGLQPQTAAFRDEVAAAFGVSSFSLYRPGDSGDHGAGLAVDFMVPESSALGDQIAEYAISQIATGRVKYVIWKQRIYGSWTNGWQMMEDRGSITQNHYDHVHVSMN